MSLEPNQNSSLKVAATTTQAHVRFQRAGVQQNKKRQAHIAGGLKRKMTPFERRYSMLGQDLIPEKKRIDYVLVHPHRRLEEHDSKSKKLDYERHESNRSQFEVACKAEGLRIQKDVVGNMVYTKLHTPFKRLCLEAERINMEMPLKGVSSLPLVLASAHVYTVFLCLFLNSHLDLLWRVPVYIGMSGGCKIIIDDLQLIHWQSCRLMT